MKESKRMDNDERLGIRRKLMARLQQTAQKTAELREECMAILDMDPEENLDAMEAWRQIVEHKGAFEISNCGDMILAAGYHLVMQWIDERCLDIGILDDEE